MKCARNGTDTIDIEAENARGEAMEAAMAADPTAADTLGAGGRGGKGENLQPTASSLRPPASGLSPPASSLQPPACLLSDLMAETSDRVEAIGICMIDVAGAIPNGNSAWAQNQCQAAAANARRAADLFDQIAERLTEPPAARALVKRLGRGDRRCLSEAMKRARNEGTELWAVIGEKAPDKDPWEWTLLMIHTEREKAATSRRNWNDQPCTRSTHAIRVV